MLTFSFLEAWLADTPAFGDSDASPARLTSLPCFSLSFHFFFTLGCQSSSPEDFKSEMTFHLPAIKKSLQARYGLLLVILVICTLEGQTNTLHASLQLMSACLSWIFEDA